MITNISIVLFGTILFTMAASFIKNKSWKFTTMAICGIIFIVLVAYQSKQEDAKEATYKSQIANIISKVTNIDSSLRKHNLKISGDSVVPIKNFNIKFVESNNNSTNVSSNNQKGGQTAGTITNH